MMKNKVIAKQAMKIMVQKKQIKTLCKCLSDIQMMLVCVGGPLNDNVLKYSNAQLVPFQKILDIVED